MFVRWPFYCECGIQSGCTFNACFTECFISIDFKLSSYQTEGEKYQIVYNLLSNKITVNQQLVSHVV